MGLEGSRWPGRRAVNDCPARENNTGGQVMIRHRGEDSEESGHAERENELERYRVKRNRRYR